MTTQIELTHLYEAKCIVCGSYSCQQNINHSKVSYKSMENVIHQCVNLMTDIDQNHSKLLNNEENLLPQKQNVVRNHFFELISKQKSKPLFSKMVKQLHKLFRRTSEKQTQNTAILEISKLFMMSVLKKHSILYFNYCEIISNLCALNRLLKINSMSEVDQIQIIKLKSYSQVKNYKLFKNVQTHIKQLTKIGKQFQNKLVDKQNVVRQLSENLDKQRANPKSQSFNIQKLVDEGHLVKRENVTFFIEQLKKIRKNKNTYAKLSNPQYQSTIEQSKFKLLSIIRQNLCTQEMKLAPRRKSFQKAIKFSNKNPQQIEYNELLYIQGIGFPSNRTYLDFSILDINDKMLFSYISTLDNFKLVSQLCLRHNNLSTISFSLLKNTFQNLKSLDVRQNFLSDQVVSSLVQFKNLNILYISDCQINCISLVKLSLNLQNLNFLYADEIKIKQRVQAQVDQEYVEQYFGIFYVMALNLKKMIYLNIRNKIINPLQSKNVGKVKAILRQRHGYLQI